MSFNPANCTTNFAFQDGYQTTLSAGITASDTVIPLTSLPTGSEGTLVIEPGTANEEEIYFTSQGTGVVNCPSASAGRGVNSTAVAHNSGVTVKMLITQANMDALKYGGALTAGSITNTKLSTTAITLGKASITTAFSHSTNNAYVDVTDLAKTITVPAGGRDLEMTVSARDMYSTYNGACEQFIGIFEGATMIAEFAATAGGVQYKIPISYSTQITPTAGSHTYKVCIKQAVAGTQYIDAGATYPAVFTLKLV